MPRSLAATICAALVTIAVISPSEAVQERAAPCECADGYYHRRADAEDMRCVSRRFTRQNPGRECGRCSVYSADGYCLSGYVFRDAFNGDGVCVVPKARSRVHSENANPMQYVHPTCYLGLFNSEENPNDG